MASRSPPFDPPDALNPHLGRTETDSRPIVVMTCGIAGSGKSSVSHWIVANYPTFQRLSIDGWVYSHYGLYGRDYPPEKYPDFQNQADNALQTELTELLRSGSRNVVLDFSFAYRQRRDDWKSLVESSGGRWVLVYLDVDTDELRRRVRARNMLTDKDGDSAFPVTEEILQRYIVGFERPHGEGEIVLGSARIPTV